MTLTGLFLLTIAALTLAWELGGYLAGWWPTVSEWWWSKFAGRHATLIGRLLYFALGFLACHLVLGDTGNG